MQDSSDNKYDGLPCKKCGGTLRYKNKGACVACARERSKSKYIPVVKLPKENTYTVRGTIKDIRRTLKVLKASELAQV